MISSSWEYSQRSHRNHRRPRDCWQPSRSISFTCSCSVCWHGIHSFIHSLGQQQHDFLVTMHVSYIFSDHFSGPDTAMGQLCV